MSEASELVAITMSSDEMLVLFELLSRYAETDELRIRDPAEQRVLWNLQCVLEKSLAEPFDSRYTELLEVARSRLRDSAEVT